MRTLRLLVAALVVLFVTTPVLAEPAEAPARVDLTPGIPVVEIPSPPAARMHVLAAPGAAAGVARSLAEGLDAERAELEALLGGLDAGPMEIRFAYGREEFAALQPRGGRVPGWAAGVAWPGLGLVVIDAQASGRNGDVRAVLRHELAHVALGRLVQGHMPRWFTEGFAQIYANEWTLSRSTTLARASAAGALLPVREIDEGWPGSPTDVDLAYAQSASLVAFLASSGDGAVLQRLVRHLGAGEPFADALIAAYGQPLILLELDWKRAMQSRYGWLPLFTDTNVWWAGAAVLLVLGAWRARGRSRRGIEAMEDGPELEPAVSLPVALPAGAEEPALQRVVLHPGEENGVRLTTPGPCPVLQRRAAAGHGKQEGPPAGPAGAISPGIWRH
ncbi:peptidase MA family metallohydrolase [Vulgatibacter sp.]|uniref:peptidase MA family metallohydrolase n=1 Tax=Vulgatibacter sp. TaxID=1971226 RepID=UPI00356AF4B6